MNKNMVFVILIALLVGGFVSYRIMKMQTPVTPSTPAMDLRTAERKLWEDHITWTRNYIISALAGLEDAPVVVERLLQNQVDLGNAIKPLYGEDAGNALTALLKDHIVIAAEVVTAAKAGDKTTLKTASDKWTANADDLAKFLSSANPNWSEATLRDMLHKHLELTTGEVTSRLGKDWKKDIEFYDKGHEHMLMFSDVLTDGIVKQFPDKF